MKFQRSLAYILTFCVVSPAVADSPSQTDKWLPTVELEGRVNSDRSLFAPKFLIPLAQDSDSMIFTDIRTRLDDHNSEEYNLGLGYRHIWGDWILGGYGFVDYLNSANNYGYWQGTLGFEALSEDWDFRVNGYLPEATKHSLGGGASSLVISGGGAFSIVSGGGGVERAMPGFDAEVGYRLPVQAVDLRVFGGMYHFDADDFDNVTGPKARVELTMDHERFEAIPDGVELTAGVQYQNDGPREGITTALVQLRIPFGGGASMPRLSRLEKRMTNFIERDVDIVAQNGITASTTTEPAVVTINGRPYSQIATTIDASTANINNALTLAGADALVVIDSSGGEVRPSVTIVPLEGQALIGSGTAISAKSASGATASGVISRGAAHHQEQRRCAG